VPRWAERSARRAYGLALDSLIFWSFRVDAFEEVCACCFRLTPRAFEASGALPFPEASFGLELSTAFDVLDD